MRIAHQPRAHASGFSLLEVVIALVLVALVSTSALASLRGGLRALSGMEQAAVAVDAMRELREYCHGLTLAEIDALDGTSFAPLLGNGDPLPGAESASIALSVVPVADLDPGTVVGAGASTTRLLTADITLRGKRLLEASWLVGEN